MWPLVGWSTLGKKVKSVVRLVLLALDEHWQFHHLGETLRLAMTDRSQDGLSSQSLAWPPGGYKGIGFSAKIQLSWVV